MAWTTLLDNNTYYSWTRDPEWLLSFGNTTASLVSPLSPTRYTKRLWKAFEITVPANAAELTVEHHREEGTFAEPPPMTPGLTGGKIVLRRPGWLGSVTLYDQEGDLPFTNVLDSEDITSYLSTAGTYYLELWGDVLSATSHDPSGDLFDHSFSVFRTLLLRADLDPPGIVSNVQAAPESMSSVLVSWDAEARTDSYKVYWRKSGDTDWTWASGITDLFFEVPGLDMCDTYEFRVAAVNVSGEGDPSLTVEERPFCTFDVALLDSLTIQETFDTQRIRHIQLSDRVYPKEGFHLLSFTALVTAEEYLIVGAPTNRVRRFERGAPYMYFDTPKVNFGAPDTEKTLCEIHIHSESETPFTTQVFYSLDDGANWTFITAVSVSRDSMAFVHPWITSNEFMVRFAGHGLHIHSYALFARPTGRLAKQN